MKRIRISLLVIILLVLGALVAYQVSIPRVANPTQAVLASSPSAPVARLRMASRNAVTFAAIGDFGLAGKPEADVARLVLGWNPDFILALGDDNYENGSADSIDANIGQYYHSYIAPYKGTYGQGASTNKFFPVPGNHDWITAAAQPYLDYFSISSGKRYYDFVRGPVHFFMLDSDPHEPDGNTADSVQAQWLKQALAASSSSWNIVVMHHAPFSSGKHGSTVAVQWPFHEWGADVVLAGHDHTYERLTEDGIPYFVDGVGGSTRYEFGNPIPGSQVRYNADFGAMRISATDRAIIFQFFNRAGDLIDSYNLGR